MDAEGDIQSLLIAEAALLKAEEKQEDERTTMKQKVKGAPLSLLSGS
jgi:hypothetical protein